MSIDAPILVTAAAGRLGGVGREVVESGTIATPAPGPLHVDRPGKSIIAIAIWPVIWIPAFLAPVGIFLQVVSIRLSLARLASC